MANCYSCGQEITFDEYHVSAITGKKIPLNPGGSVPHDCPVKKKQYQQSTQGQAMRKSYPNTAPPDTDENNDEGYEDKMQQQEQPVESTTKQQFFNQRDADIKLAHKENIAATTALTNAIHVLAAAIGKLADRQQKDDESVGFEFMSRSDNPENEP